MSAQPIQISSLYRRFAERVALQDIDLRVERGEIVALVGPNGSGKTTLLKIVGGFLRPTQGRVRVFGHEPFGQQARVMESARFAFAPPALYDSLTPFETLQYLAAIRARHAEPVRRAEIESTLDLVGLRARADDRVRTLSFGMRQRLVLAQALLPRPRLLVLDEPTDGLDPLAILELRHILKNLRNDHGITILLSSHLLIEIEKTVDRLLVLSEGRCLFLGSPHELLHGMGRVRLGVDARDQAIAFLREVGFESQPVNEHELELQDGSLDLERAATLLRGRGIQLRTYHVHRPTLEEAFLRQIRNDAAQGGGGTERAAHGATERRVDGTTERRVDDDTGAHTEGGA
jgi:ABC-2 type transport system ATP-binding protein